MFLSQENPCHFVFTDGYIKFLIHTMGIFCPPDSTLGVFMKQNRINKTFSQSADKQMSDTRL